MVMLAAPHPLPGASFPFAAPGSRCLALRRCRDEAQWRHARALRFSALAAAGEIGGARDPAFGDAHDAAPNCATYLLERSGRPVGTTRTSVSAAGAGTGAAVPAAAAFGPALDALAAEGGGLVEASLTLADPASPLDPGVVLFHLFRAPLVTCAAAGARWLLTAARERDIGFFVRVFAMEILTSAEAVPGLGAPRVLMGLRFAEQAPALFARFPSLAPSPAQVLAFLASGEVAVAGPRPEADEPD